jgi:hypothetical protein
MSRWQRYLQRRLMARQNSAQQWTRIAVVQLRPRYTQQERRLQQSLVRRQALLPPQRKALALYV